jgi:hypothetical protein
VIHVHWRYSSHNVMVDGIAADCVEIRCDEDGRFNLHWDVIDGDDDGGRFISDLDFFECKDVSLDFNVDRVCFD